MILIGFNEIFPSLAEKERKIASVINHHEIPDGSYNFLELYCPSIDCDCRYVRIDVVNNEGDNFGKFSWGWEEKKFYDAHFGFEDHDLPGPRFSPFAFQSKHAAYFFQILESFCNSDPEYISRIKNHYALIRQEAPKIDILEFLKPKSNQKPTKLVRKSEKVMGRNELCFCGSNKKYKKCCISQISLL